MLTYILVIGDVIGKGSFYNSRNLGSGSVIPVDRQEIPVGIGRAGRESVRDKCDLIGQVGDMTEGYFSSALVGCK